MLFRFTLSRVKICVGNPCQACFWRIYHERHLIFTSNASKLLNILLYSVVFWQVTDIYYKTLSSYHVIFSYRGLKIFCRLLVTIRGKKMAHIFGRKRTIVYIQTKFRFLIVFVTRVRVIDLIVSPYGINTNEPIKFVYS